MVQRDNAMRIAAGSAACLACIVAQIACGNWASEPEYPAVATVAVSTGLSVDLAGQGQATVDATAGYLRTAPAEEVLLAQQSAEVNTGSNVEIPLQVDIAPCLADSRRAASGDACPVVVKLTLRRAALTLDSLRVGPVSAVAGGTLDLGDTLMLREVALLEITWAGKTAGATGDTLRDGRNLTLQAVPRDAGGAAVSGKAVSWASGAPQVATVDAASGAVTAVAPGTASIVATAGGRTAVFAARVLATPESVFVAAGDGQRDDPGNTLPFGPTVRVTDLAGRPAEAITVNFTLVSGGGQIMGALQLTNAQGEARLGSWTLGPQPAVNELDASVAGVSLPARIIAYGTIAPSRGQLAAGNFHGCAIIHTGETWCWGSRIFAQLGDGVLNGPPSIPVPVSGNPQFTELDADGHTCGLRGDGTALCWGRNVFGEIGDGTLGHKATPVAVVGSPYLQISSGRLTGCGRRSPGAVFCWGHNQRGEIGNPSVPIGGPNLQPVQIQSSESFSHVSAGWIHACALTTGGAQGGQAFCWGTGLQSGGGDTTTRFVPAPVVGAPLFARLNSGGVHSCGLTPQGEAWCWGDNTRGQLGDGGTTTSFSAIPVTGGLYYSMIAPNSLGPGHTCALTITGEVYCWGANPQGQLGDSTTIDRLVPTRVPTPEVFVAVDTGDQFSCAMTPDRRVFCWGTNAQGELGSGQAGGFSATPVEVPLPFAGGSGAGPSARGSRPSASRTPR